MNTSTVQEQAFGFVSAGDITALSALLTNQPEIKNAINTEGTSLLMFSIYNQKKDITDMLIRRGVRLDVFSASAYGALTEIVAILRLEPGLVNTFSPEGWTPLHLASFFGNNLIVEYLLMSRADIGAVSRNSQKNQPLNAATVSNKTDVALLLIKKGADVNFAQHEGVTPLHAAAHNGNEKLVEILLADGADKNVRDEKGETPFDKAMQRGHQNVIAILQSS